MGRGMYLVDYLTGRRRWVLLCVGVKHVITYHHLLPTPTYCPLLPSPFLAYWGREEEVELPCPPCLLFPSRRANLPAYVPVLEVSDDDDIITCVPSAQPDNSMPFWSLCVGMGGRG